MRNKSFIILVMTFLIIIPVYMIFIKTPNEKSEIENRYLVTFDDLEGKSFFDKSFQSTLADALMDQFIMRYRFNNMKKQVELFSINVLEPLYIKDKTDLTLSFVPGTGVVRVGNSNYLMNYVMDYKEEYEEQYLSRFSQINQLQKDFPNIRINVYKPTQIHEVDFFDEPNDIKSFGKFYNDLFIENLEVNYSSLKIDNVSPYFNYFYGSDHHWNNRGSYQGYLDILALLNVDELPISINDEICNEQNIFNGTFSSRTSFVYPGDSMCAYHFKDLVDTDVSSISSDYGSVEVNSILGKTLYQVEHVENSNTFADKNTEILPEGYYYNEAFPAYGPLSVFDSHQVEKKSILIIGDSYMGPVLPLLSNHFNKIYAVNPSTYQELTGEYFDTYQFLNEIEVDEVLIMYTIENYFHPERYGAFEIIRK